MSEKVLVLKTCTKNLKSSDGMQWTASGEVVASYWDSDPKSGNGLYGLLWGEGNGYLLNWRDTAKWLVVEVTAEDIVLCGGWVKFPKGNVVFCGDRKSATDYIRTHGGEDKIIVGSILTGGDYANLKGGYRSRLIGGNYSKLTGGAESKLTGGDYSVLCGGANSVLMGGNHATLVGGEDSLLIGGEHATVSGRLGSTFQVVWYNVFAYQYKIAVGHVKQNELQAGKAYRVDRGKFYEVE